MTKESTSVLTFLVSLPLAIILVFSPHLVAAYPDANMNIHWPFDVLQFNINPTDFPVGSTHFNSALAGISSWDATNVPKSHLFVSYEMVNASPLNHNDGHNTIGYAPLPPTVNSITLARTTPRQISEFPVWWAEVDIEINDSLGIWADTDHNPDPERPYNYHNLEGTVRHEAGHAVGFYVHEDRGPRVAVMNAKYSFGNSNDLYMHGDDRNGLRNLYPADGFETDIQVIGWKLTDADSGEAKPVDAPSPEIVIAGQTVTVEYTIENLGTTVPTNVRLGFYLSTNSTISPSDALIATKTFLELAPPADGGNDNVPIATYRDVLTVPNETPPGIYYVGVILDDQFQYTESREENNYIVLPLPQRPKPIQVIPLCQPLASPSLTSPADSSTLQEPWVYFDWADIEGATGYKLQIGTTCENGAEYEVMASEYSVDRFILPYYSSYYWRVSTRDSCGQYGPYSACYSFNWANSELPLRGYIGLYSDEYRSSMEAHYTGQITEFDMYIFCLPSRYGLKGGEFRISYPSSSFGVIQGDITYNPNIIVWLGTLEGGISYSSEICHFDWTWACHQKLYLTSSAQRWIHIASHPGTGRITFADCRDGYPMEDAIYLNGLAINQHGILGTELQGFSAVPKHGGVEVAWQLSQSAENFRFHILRNDCSQEEFIELLQPEVSWEAREYVFRDKACEPGRTYRYRVEIEEMGSRRLLFETDAVSVPALPLSLFQNQPNPFNPSTTIRYYIPGRCGVLLEVYDITGKRIACLANEEQEQGSHEAQWNGMDGRGNSAASGVYFYRLRAGKETIAKKMVLLR